MKLIKKYIIKGKVKFTEKNMEDPLLFRSLSLMKMCRHMGREKFVFRLKLELRKNIIEKLIY